MRKLTITAALLATATFANPAQAGHFLFQYDAYEDYSDPLGPISATLHLTTSDTLNVYGGYDVLSATGSIDGDAVLGLKNNPNQPDTYGDGLYLYNNILYTPGPAFDQYGIVVTTATKEYNFGYDIEDFSGDPAYPYYGISNDGSTHISPISGNVVPTYRVSVGTASLTEEAVPEPASWAMMVAGFGLAGAAMRRRRSAVAFG